MYRWVRREIWRPGGRVDITFEIYKDETLLAICYEPMRADRLLARFRGELPSCQTRKNVWSGRYL